MLIWFFTKYDTKITFLTKNDILRKIQMLNLGFNGLLNFLFPTFYKISEQ